MKIRDEAASVINNNSLKEDGVDCCLFRVIPSSYEWPLDPHVASIHHPSKGPQRRQQRMQFFHNYLEDKGLASVPRNCQHLKNDGCEPAVLIGHTLHKNSNTFLLMGSGVFSLSVLTAQAGLLQPGHEAVRLLFYDSQMTSKSVAIRV